LIKLQGCAEALEKKAETAKQAKALRAVKEGGGEKKRRRKKDRVGGR